MGEELNNATETGTADEQSLFVPEEDASENQETGNEDQEQESQEAGERQESETQEPTIEEKYAELERNYQRLERKFTRVTQHSQGASEAMQLYSFIASNPELTAHVNQLLQTYEGTIPVSQLNEVQFDPAAERVAMKELLGRPDFVKHEDEIAEWAEDNGLAFDSALDQRHAYQLWKGENADRLIQEARLDSAKKAAKLKEAKGKAGLQRSGGPGSPPPVDYTKMSDTDVLAHMGLSLWSDD